MVAALAALVAGCGAQPDDGLEPGHVANLVPASQKRCAPGEVRKVGSAKIAYAAVVDVDGIRAYRRPGRKPFAVFARENANGVPTVFGIRSAVLDRLCKPAWYHVQLPMRPNGVTGYVPARALEVGTVRTRIAVDLSARRLTLYRNARVVLRTRVAIGSPATPTPLGRYYVNQRLIPEDTSGPFGPGAIGISAFSEVLTGWTQGGPVAIHGTNRPDSIGRAVSNGCIRVENRTLRRIFGATLSGTPVVIHP